jgi:hypothetical protein
MASGDLIQRTKRPAYALIVAALDALLQERHDGVEHTRLLVSGEPE